MTTKKLKKTELPPVIDGKVYGNLDPVESNPGVFKCREDGSLYRLVNLQLFRLSYPYYEVVEPEKKNDR